MLKIMQFDDNIIRVCKNMKLKISHLKHKNLYHIYKSSAATTLQKKAKSGAQKDR